MSSGGKGTICNPDPGMIDPHHNSHPPDRLEAALEASCGTLITLESILASTAFAPADSRDVQPQLCGAIESLRRAIVELRLLRAEGSWLPALDFVLAAG